MNFLINLLCVKVNTMRNRTLKSGFISLTVVIGCIVIYFSCDEFLDIAFYRREPCSLRSPQFYDDRVVNTTFALRNKLRLQYCKELALPLYRKQKFKKSDSLQINNSDCSTPYVTMNYRGQLGNNICQYISLLLLQKFFDVRIAVHPTMYETLSTNFQELKAPLFSSKNFCGPTKNLSYPLLYKQLYEIATLQKDSNYYLNESIYVDSYPCPAEIIMPHRNFIKSQLGILPGVLVLAQEHLQSLLSKFPFIMSDNATIVSVHVRRTDYFHHMRFLFKRTVLTSCYYHNAMNYIRNRFGNVVFVISSDDLAWCEKNLAFKDVVIAGKGSNTNPLFDFALMSLCDHHIVGLGTYGFTSAFLGKGTITYPMVDTINPSEIESSYVCSSSSSLIPILDQPLLWNGNQRLCK